MPSPVSPTWSFKWTLILSALHSLAIGVATARLLYSTKHGPLSWDDAFFCTAILGDLAMLIVFLTFETSLSDNTHLLLYWTTIDLYFLVTWTLKAAFTMMIMFVNGVRLHRYRRTIRLIACALVVVGMLYCLTSNLLCGLPFKQTHVVTSFCPVPLQIGVLNMICSVFIDVAQTATAVYLCQKDARFFYSSARPIIYFYLSANIFSIIATVVCWIEVYTRDSSDTFITIHLTNFIVRIQSHI
ncbi:hypothetical protein CPC08DRAFT_769138 [Agrocybe pediades]|nr:hypothetical protein CPC08DRAFT_769138 [Agrocybe pediades]